MGAITSIVGTRVIAPASATHGPSNTPPAIRLDAVSKAYATPAGAPLQAVRNVTLEVARGEVFGLVGTSGAGKSTLLRLINRLEEPDSGRVFVGPHEITALGRADLRAARQDIGMIFQQFNLLQNASVFDNVAFPLGIHGRWTEGDILRRVRECLELVGLLDKIGAYPAQLSGGQKQRVAIARALAPRPEVLLCDEPTSALDAETTRSVIDTLREVNQRLGVTILIVTHELAVVHSLCRTVAVMEGGELVEQFGIGDAGTPTERRRSALGRELARLAVFDDLQGELERLESVCRCAR